MADWPKGVTTIAVVTWDDSHGVTGWQVQHQWDEDFKSFDSTCVSVGYIAYEDERRVWLMKSLSACGSMGDALMIPKHAILERHEIVVADLEAQQAEAPGANGHSELSLEPLGVGMRP